MKSFLFTLAAALLLFSANGQNKNLKKQPSFGFQFSLIDFETANDLRTKSLARVVDEKQWSNIDRMLPAITLNYQQGITNHIDFMGRLTTTFLRYPLRNPSAITVNDQFYAELDANVMVKLLPDNFFMVPYLNAGVGAVKAGNTFLAQIPLGAGLQFNIKDAAFVHLNSGYRIPVTGRGNYSLMHSLGIVVPLRERPVEKKVEVVVPEPPKDRDGDGILDVDDDCPDVKGLAKFKGCPDTDGDGIADKDDKCPTVAGVAKYGGCPVPDTDGDGINDDNDKCPTVKGVARYDGCPVPDTDGDGVNDENDKCPTVAGPADNDGCPRVESSFLPQNVVFQTGSAVLLPRGRAELDKVVEYLKGKEGFDLTIEGHTDNTGSDRINNPLSLRRAEAVKAYLAKNGIAAERLYTEGFGATQPVADNGTAAGRAQNRRVEIKVRK